MTEYDKIKFRDDCAIAAMRVFVRDINKPSDVRKLVEISFDIAEAMLEEKLKRDKKDD
jgi:hypothetical protein